MTTILSNACAVAFLTALLAACGKPAPEAAPPATERAPAANAETDALAPGAHTWITADGNRMPYTVAGEGEITLVLVHCWMCNRTFWSEQVPALAGRFRVLAMDLPGHGEATAARDAWTVAGYGEDVAGLLRGLDLTNVVLVGHSMGGPVSLKAAALSGDRVRGIVAVDTLHNAEFEFAGEQVEEMQRSLEKDFAGACGEFVRQMFPEPDAGAVMERVRETSCREDRKAVGVALMRDFGRIDMPRWFREAGVPIRAIVAAGGMPAAVEVNRKYADFDAVALEGVGHYLHMTRPDAFNPLLLAAIDEILPP
ncbi:MAG TPA: alpha/beta hydrolase [Woeseiaceae bacterium]